MSNKLIERRSFLKVTAIGGGVMFGLQLEPSLLAQTPAQAPARGGGRGRGAARVQKTKARDTRREKKAASSSIEHVHSRHNIRTKDTTHTVQKTAGLERALFGVVAGECGTIRKLIRRMNRNFGTIHPPDEPKFWNDSSAG